MDNKEFYKQLVQRYHSGKANEQEIALFLELLRTGQIDDIVERHMEEQSGVEEKKRQKTRYYRLLKYAAALLLVTLTGTSLFYNWYMSKRKMEIALMNNIGPATFKATLKLADGRHIMLDSTFGELIIQDSAVKDQSGRMVHQGENEYYEVNVPKGGTFHLNLSDGSKVWLNSGSTLRFPQKFAGNLRKIELKGEAFFEVRKQTGSAGERIPFIVQTSKQTVEVLGTSFNVKAYGEGNESATLFTGLVRLKNNKNNHEKMLSPGDKAVLERNGEFKVGIADLEEEASWRSDAFVFNETPINDILNQLSRWYNVDIEFIGSAEYSFNGYLQRNVSLGEALETLKGTGELDYQYQNHKVIIKQKKTK
ncbi:fec operon regulator FecR [Sphingobacterium spiritivorum]|uniref:Fec operon regulator FecR n=1 Tax=Sphingobacterium spiritivorum TaxID=258 RepID=A0A380CUG2_SPHSI|nr:FecR family protein [Sphingobacterium spiritivorum]SUJ29223.1 fec operon regulator FecR [Sphingobacterium spiritivorum]